MKPKVDGANNISCRVVGPQTIRAINFTVAVVFCSIADSAWL